jgi:hypothetical protein
MTTTTTVPVLFEARVDLSPAAPSEDGARVRTFRCLFATGQRIPQHGWYPNVYVDLEGMVVDSQRQPVLLDHETPIGFTTSIARTSAGMVAEGVLCADHPEAERVARMADQGFPWRCSAGLPPDQVLEIPAGQMASVNGTEVEGPATLWMRPRLDEISFLATPADRGTVAEVFSGRPAAQPERFMLELKDGAELTAEALAEYPDLVRDAAAIVAARKEDEANQPPEADPPQDSTMADEPTTQTPEDKAKPTMAADADVVFDIIEAATPAQHKLCRELVAEFRAGTKTLSQCFVALATDPRRDAHQTRQDLEDVAPEALPQGAHETSETEFEAAWRKLPASERSSVYGDQIELFQAERDAIAAGAFGANR